MDGDEIYQALATALRRLEEAREADAKERAALAASFEQLLSLLQAKGILNEGHLRMIEKVGERAAPSRRRVRLRQFVDKYALPGGDIDCASRLHLCHARCCAFSFELTSQDLDEGVVRWELEEPYLIRHDADGFCTHLDRATLGCGIYEKRPATCRGFDCRQDRRVWLDFENAIPAPMPPGLLPPRIG